MILIEGMHDSQQNKHCRHLDIINPPKRCAKLTLSTSAFVLLVLVTIAETTHIHAALKRFVCNRHPTVDTLTVKLGVNSTKPIVATDKPIVKEINKRLGYMVDPNNTGADRVYCGLQTMKAIDFLSMALQGL